MSKVLFHGDFDHFHLYYYELPSAKIRKFWGLRKITLNEYK